MEKRFRITPFFLAILSTLLITSFGCSDTFFEEKAGDRITPDQHYQTIYDAMVSLQGTIMPLQEMMPRLILLDGLRSDMMEVTNNADAYMRDINDQIFSVSNPYTNTAELYQIIINVNEILANIDKVSLKDRNFDETYAVNYKGALLGFRGWAYLTLVRLYGKAAYIEDNMVSLPGGSLAQKVITKDAMIDTLINQITPYIQNSVVSGKVELRIGHFPNTKALLGELYLEKGDYANAALYLKLACESYMNQPSLLKVDKTFKDALWFNIFFNADGQLLENIGVIPYSSTEGQYNPLTQWVGHSFQYLVRPTQMRVDSFMSQLPSAGAPGDLYRGLGITFGVDTTSFTWLTDTTYTFETENFITKYEINASEPFSSDLVYSRAADLHLLLAEALNRSGDSKSALMLLNAGVNKENPKPAAYSKWANNLGVRGRVSLKSKTVPATMSADSVTMMVEDYIIEERALELAFEGKRWDDLVRVAVRRGTPEYLADKIALKYGDPGSSKYEEMHAKLMNPANWYLPYNGIELPVK